MDNGAKLVRLEGLVEENLPGLLFRVKINIGSETRGVLAHLAGRLKINHIRIIPGDRVLVEMPNPEDKRGRIVRRL
jgi:translation initiation factor IF-1